MRVLVYVVAGAIGTAIVTTVSYKVQRYWRRRDGERE